LPRPFPARHQAPHLLLLANAWDALSARIVEDAGFEAVATTSGGIQPEGVRRKDALAVLHLG
jgi:2-methylisocitrate lyase-like PEP mutase family enzyme